MMNKEALLSTGTGRWVFRVRMTTNVPPEAIPSARLRYQASHRSKGQRNVAKSRLSRIKFSETRFVLSQSYLWE